MSDKHAIKCSRYYRSRDHYLKRLHLWKTNFILDLIRSRFSMKIPIIYPIKICFSISIENVWLQFMFTDINFLKIVQISAVTKFTTLTFRQCCHAIALGWPSGAALSRRKVEWGMKTAESRNSCHTSAATAKHQYRMLMLNKRNFLSNMKIDTNYKINQQKFNASRLKFKIILRHTVAYAKLAEEERSISL